MLGAHEAKLLYEMNKKAKITIKTPVGNTQAIEVEEITKQGTLSTQIKSTKLGQKISTP
jgi:hypothetical protein